MLFREYQNRVGALSTFYLAVPEGAMKRRIEALIRDSILTTGLLGREPAPRDLVDRLEQFEAEFQVDYTDGGIIIGNPVTIH